MVRLVDDLLDLSRINSDKLELQRQPVALSEVISQAVETVRPMIAEAGHELAIDLPQELMELNADTVRLSQAFANLLNNACKYKVEERKMVENSVPHATAKGKEAPPVAPSSTRVKSKEGAPTITQAAMATMVALLTQLCNVPTLVSALPAAPESVHPVEHYPGFDLFRRERSKEIHPQRLIPTT